MSDTASCSSCPTPRRSSGSGTATNQHGKLRTLSALTLNTPDVQANAQLSSGTTISGIVTDSAGVPLAGIVVRAVCARRHLDRELRHDNRGERNVLDGRRPTERVSHQVRAAGRIWLPCRVVRRCADSGARRLGQCAPGGTASSTRPSPVARNRSARLSENECDTRVTLRHVDPTRPPGMLARAYAALAATRLARFISRHVSWKLDPLLLRATGGRVATHAHVPDGSARDDGREERRAASERDHLLPRRRAGHRSWRRTPAARGSPSWYHNLRAHPDVTFGRHRDAGDRRR